MRRISADLIHMIARSKLSLLFLVFLTSACTTIQSGIGLFRESATDTHDNAPKSMSMRRSTASGSDKLNAQSQADYHFTLAEAYSLEGNFSRAIEEYKLTLLYDSKSAQVRTRLASEYARQGLVSEALENAKLALKEDPKHVEALFVLGAINSGLRLYEEALSAYQKVVEIDKDNTEAQLYIGAIYAEQKDFPKALTQFHLLASNPSNAGAHMAWYYVGRVLSEKSPIQNVPRAKDAYEKAITLKGSYLEPVLALGQLMESNSKPNEAIKVYQTYQNKHGSNPMVAEALARLYLERSEWLKAYDQLRVIEAADPEDLNVKMRIAFIFVETKKYQDAIQKLEEILSQAPNSDKVRYYLGAVYEEIRDFKSAIEHFKKIGVESSYFNEATVHVTYLYKLMGDYDRAVAAVDEGIKKKQENPQFYTLQASLYDEQKKYSEAYSILRKAVEKFPENTQILFFYGATTDRLNKKEETEKTMRTVLKLDKDHVQAMNYLAYLLAESGRSLDEAETLARRANELQPNDGYILDTLGWVVFKKGKVEEAIRLLETAHNVQPDEAVIAEHLGDVYYSKQLPERARRMYVKAAENEEKAAKSDPMNVEKIRKKLASIDRQQDANDGRRPASNRPAK